ncbi:MAG: TatD family hydrolase [Candidatus Saccharibacteria bacterium]|nr:TatD family hydrolase [Candidatus Saccharibacteria bacterium]
MDGLGLIDSHCHLHDSEFYPEAKSREAACQRAVAQDIGMIVVGTDERSSAEAVAFAEAHEYVWAAVGVHPHDAKAGWAQIEALLKAGSSKVVAVGEIGLDYFYNNSPRDVQIQALEAQLQLAVDYNLPVSFHVRDAFDDFWPVLDNFHGVYGVLHSFTDTQANLEKGFERGLYVGLNGISTFTRDSSQQELYRTIPLEKILLETDAPFLTPKPFRGKMNEPGYVELVAKFWAQERQMALSELKTAVTNNTRILFGL